MAGIRLRHPHFARVTLVVELPSRYPRPYDCPRCRKLHEYKAIHLQLDDQGCVIVARPVYEKLLQVHLAGMEVVNEVPRPPDMAIGAIEQLKAETIEVPLNGHGQQFWTPGKDKYESRDAMVKPLQPVLDKKAEEVDRRQTAERAKRRSIHIFGRRRK